MGGSERGIGVVIYFDRVNKDYVVVTFVLGGVILFLGMLTWLLRL